MNFFVQVCCLADCGTKVCSAVSINLRNSHNRTEGGAWVCVQETIVEPPQLNPVKQQSEQKYNLKPFCTNGKTPSDTDAKITKLRENCSLSGCTGTNPVWLLFAGVPPYTAHCSTLIEIPQKCHHGKCWRLYSHFLPSGHIFRIFCHRQGQGTHPSWGQWTKIMLFHRLHTHRHASTPTHTQHRHGVEINMGDLSMPQLAVHPDDIIVHGPMRTRQNVQRSIIYLCIFQCISWTTQRLLDKFLKVNVKTF